MNPPTAQQLVDVIAVTIDHEMRPGLCELEGPVKAADGRWLAAWRVPIIYREKEAVSTFVVTPDKPDLTYFAAMAALKDLRAALKEAS